MSYRIAWTPEIEAKARALHAEGRGPTYIGREIGVDNKTVKRRFKKIGLKIEPIGPDWTDAEVAIIRAGAASGKTWQATTDSLRVAGFRRSLSAVRRLVYLRKIRIVRPTRPGGQPKVRELRVHRRTSTGGFPALRGTPEARDDLYVRLCLEQSLELGLARAA